MPIDPGLSFKVLRPDQIDNIGRQAQLEQANVERIPVQRRLDQQQMAMGDANVRLKQIEEAAKRTDRRLQLLATAQDQSSWQRVLQQAAAEGEDVSDEPMNFDPGYVRQLAMQGISMKDRLKLEMDKLLNDAKVVTEGAQARSYGALTNQRNTAADLNAANAARVRAIPNAPAPTAATTNAPNVVPGELTAGQKRSFDVQQKVQAKAKGQKDLNDLLNDIKSKYQNLAQSGGIVDTTKSGPENLVAKLRSSTAGQLAGAAVGSQDQSTRQAIKNSLPLLMAAIKNATGMSSQQMNSNAELQFYMQAATDPRADLQSNLNALENLSKMFSNGPVENQGGYSGMSDDEIRKQLGL